MIAQKYHGIVFAFFMALLMSSLMSFVITVFNLGFVHNIIFIWLKAWAFAFIVAFPAVIIVTPTVRKLVRLVVRDK